MVSSKPMEPETSTVPQVQNTVPVQPVVLVFGDEEAIQRARKRRGGRSHHRLPRLKNPITVKDIPAEPARVPSSEATQPETEIVISSLWEMACSDEDETHVA
jgi:hypothetical protein